jgi:hypothetical protein
MTITPNRISNPVTVADADQINTLVLQAEACLEQTAAQIRALLQSRDLLAEWSDTDAAFKPRFEPTALNYHRLLRALLTLQERPFSWEHRLRELVEAQR